MKNKIIISTIIVVLIVLSSCEKIAFEKKAENTPIHNFNHLWLEVNNKYAFFDHKEVIWDSVYFKYADQIYDEMPDTLLFTVMANMLNELRDGHVNLVSPFNISRYDITLLGAVNINHRVITENYIGDDGYITGGFNHNFIRDGQIGYIWYPSFSGSIITEYELDFLMDRYKNTEGLIIDIRQNGGGYVSNVFSLLSRFSEDERLLYKTQIKSGPYEDNFSDLEEVYATKSSSDVYPGKVAILTDRGSYSASSFFSTCTYAYDNIFLVGDTTGGGLGLPNGGQLPNGWTYRFSITRTIAVNGENYENGVPPDYTVLLSDDAATTGIDNIIEFAADKILE